MSATTITPRPAVQPRTDVAYPETGDATWTPLYRVGAVAALIMIALIPVQIIIFVVWPPPLDGTAGDWFTLFQDSWLLGLLGLDLLYILTNILLIPLYLALYVALRRVSSPAMVVALALGLVGIAAYFASTVAFEMWSLSGGYANAVSDAERAAFLAAGEAMLATYQGTAFAVYYMLNAVALLIIAVVMLRSMVFSRATAYAGLLAGALMAIPSTFGTLGFIFAFASLIPWTIFTVLVAQRLFLLGQCTAREHREVH